MHDELQKDEEDVVTIQPKTESGELDQKSDEEEDKAEKVTVH